MNLRMEVRFSMFDDDIENRIMDKRYGRAVRVTFDVREAAKEYKDFMSRAEPQPLLSTRARILKRLSDDWGNSISRTIMRALSEEAEESAGQDAPDWEV